MLFVLAKFSCKKKIKKFEITPLITSITILLMGRIIDNFKICQSISTSVTEEHETVTYPNIQLYMKAIDHNFVFSPGELHIVFAYLKVINKYIENSGQDQIFIDSNIYSATAFLQILQGNIRSVVWKPIWFYI